LRSISIDGEAIVCGEDGIGDFDRLHSRAFDHAAILQAFDLLELDGDELRPLPLEVRKARLEKVLARAPTAIQLNEHVGLDGATVFAAACKMGLEGIVSKRRDMPYRSGRSKGWIKVKNPASAACSAWAEQGDRSSVQAHIDATRGRPRIPRVQVEFVQLHWQRIDIDSSKSAHTAAVTAQLP
jgi:bifunctional non-homologous end joining protein LigD